MNTKKSISGFSLVEVLVSIGVLGIGAYFAATQISTMKRAMAHAMYRTEISNLRESLYQQVNCLQTLRSVTLPNGTIACSGALPLRDLNNEELPSIIGNWQLDSQCSNTGITLRVQRLINGAIAVDPLSNTALDYANTTINPLFGRGSEADLCGGSFQGNKRVRVLTATKSQLPYASLECGIINPSSAPPNSAVSPFSPLIAVYGAPFALATQIDARCANYCQSPPGYFVGGYAVDCNSSEVTCVCYR
jgi:prepilin-type N-terminal cleavage/methylation domain-containing protein